MIRQFLLAFCLLAAALTPSLAEERIERFVSDVTVEGNGDLLVTESIQVWAEGRQIRRGILRDFPTTYHRADGSRVEVGFDVQSVMRDDLYEQFTTERMTNGVRVRIGSAGVSLNTGSHTYVIKYRTTRQIGFFKSYDELYWNATGTGWTFPIDVAEARITLPEAVPIQQSAIYTGPQGAAGKDAIIVEQKPGLIVFRTTKRLPVANGLTVAAGWQKGVVAEPTTMQRIEAILHDEPALKFAAVGGGLVIGFYLIVWLLFGRDPRRGTIIPLFGPPEGMSAAGVRFVHEMGMDDRVFSAGIVGLGVNRCLKLFDRSNGQSIQRLDGGHPADAAEKALEKSLFAKGATVPLSNSKHEVISSARSSLHRSLKDSYGDLFSNNTWAAVAGLAGSILVTVLIIAAYGESYPNDGAVIFGGVLIPLLPIMFGCSMIRSGRRLAGNRGLLQVVIGLLTLLAGVTVGIGIFGTNLGFGYAMAPAIVPYVLAAFGALGFGWLKAPSTEGRKILDQIDGFRQYLSVAEEDRLEFLNPPKKTPELFERFLPYAIALNVENSWANRFTGVLAAAGVGAAVSSWYVSNQSFTPDNVNSFADRVSDNLATTIAAAATPPGSSSSTGSFGGSSSSSDFGGGSSGGGDSGGGGGGGGGSGW
ncbi:DUF2207 domain-containing protein [Rhodoplanes sp. Z2-YC6860]|uniref:DUF2207 domain-containing protein n=1 Tax=Rhodoplanes sp. Z2-YC6860 TaxID=674703 RepID=UPI00078DC429|nr:DUF2207 domain-containing protein [Rhodoplanes sp. Z2-YC6860]AMN39600.1 transmembrane signal peptide protein [Rhodoplanes sp. Z2-YC6860]